MGGARGWVLAAVVGLGACSGRSECPGTCDRPQEVLVNIFGDEAVAAFSVSAPCATNETCAGASNCRTFRFYLKDLPDPGGAPLICHLTMTGNRGTVVERDFTAAYVSDPCCGSGYSFSSWSASITISPADGGGG